MYIHKTVRERCIGERAYRKKVGSSYLRNYKMMHKSGDREDSTTRGPNRANNGIITKLSKSSEKSNL